MPRSSVCPAACMLGSWYVFICPTRPPAFWLPIFNSSCLLMTTAFSSLFSSVQSLSHVQLSVTPWTAACSLAEPEGIDGVLWGLTAPGRFGRLGWGMVGQECCHCSEVVAVEVVGSREERAPRLILWTKQPWRSQPLPEVRWMSWGSFLQLLLIHPSCPPLLTAHRALSPTLLKFSLAW